MGTPVNHRQPNLQRKVMLLIISVFVNRKVQRTENIPPSLRIGKDDKRGKPSPMIPLVMSVRETFVLVTKADLLINQKFGRRITEFLTKRLVEERQVRHANSLSSKET